MITSKASIANAAAIAKPRSASDNDAKRKIPRKNGRYRIAAKSAITQQYAVLLERSICQRFRDQERLTVIKPNRPTTKFVKVNVLAVASLSRPWSETPKTINRVTVPSANALFLTVAEHKRARAREITQGIQSALGFSFLKNRNRKNNHHRER